MREKFKSKDLQRHPIALDAAFYTGVTYIKSYITLIKSIQKFYSHNWHNDVRRLLPSKGIDLPPAAILGKAADIEFDAGNLNTTESYLEIAPSHFVEKGMWQLNLDGERIVIQICSADLNAINQIRKNEEHSASIWASMFQRAVEEGIRKHRDIDHSYKRWAKNLQRQLHDEKLPTDDPDELDLRALEYAQKLMQNPLNKITNLVLQVQDD